MTVTDDQPRQVAHARVAGIMAGIVGPASSFAVVLAGLRAVGASPAQAASGLLALMVASGIATIFLARRYRMPILIAWSTPGAALLVSTGAVTGGWAAAVGAFAVAGLLYVLAGLWPRLGALIAAIPVPIAQAMLAGILLALCLAPVRALATSPLLVAPIIIVWLAGLRWYRKWAVPAAFATTLAVISIDVIATGSIAELAVVPRLALTMPTLTWQAVIGLAIPLFIVTMASQNVPGVTIMRTFGYAVPWRSAITTAGIGSALIAPAGGQSINLAAITAAMVASPEAHPDPAQRWRATQAAGTTYIVLGIVSVGLASFVELAPPGLIEAAAGLALLATFGSALAGALGDASDREAAIVTFLVAASGTAIAGIGAAFWALLAGLLVHLVLRHRRA